MEQRWSDKEDRHFEKSAQWNELMTVVHDILSVQMDGKSKGEEYRAHQAEQLSTFDDHFRSQHDAAMVAIQDMNDGMRPALRLKLDLTFR